MSRFSPFADRVLEALVCADPLGKAALAARLYRDYQAGRLTPLSGEGPPPPDWPGRPAQPKLVAPGQLHRRGVGSREARGALIHSIAHIEFNAINLALDAALRFRDLPHGYYQDWLKVAAEEARHFRLLRTHLRSIGYDYGDFDAHDGLWEMAQLTAHDPLVRMALVPRLLEARGLDVTPGIQARLLRAGDEAAVAILDIIFRDEIGHVRIGNRWFAWLCQQRDVDPLSIFRALLAEYGERRLRGPFHLDARRQAGFSEAELRMLETVAAR